MVRAPPGARTGVVMALRLWSDQSSRGTYQVWGSRFIFPHASVVLCEVLHHQLEIYQHCHLGTEQATICPTPTYCLIKLLNKFSFFGTYCIDLTKRTKATKPKKNINNSAPTGTKTQQQRPTKPSQAKDAYIGYKTPKKPKQNSNRRQPSENIQNTKANPGRDKTATGNRRQKNGAKTRAIHPTEDQGSSKKTQ
ncbi:hypothetical protein LXL04_027349 [Taraxacum kok-saghyz]